MLSAIRELFESRILREAHDKDANTALHGRRLATAALLFEMSRADFKVSEKERRHVEKLVQDTFDLSAGETAELLALAEAEAEEATSLFQFTSLINEHFEAHEKVEVVELLWRVAYADGRLDKYEEHLVRNVAELIHVPHREFMKAKHRVAGIR